MVTTTNVFNEIEYDTNFPILVFEYMDQFFKVLPENELDWHEYAKNNLLTGTKYKIYNNISEISSLTLEDLKTVFLNPDGIA
jgi:hypothetical protein